MKIAALLLLLLSCTLTEVTAFRKVSVITCTICHIFANYVDEHQDLSMAKCIEQGERQCESMGQFSGSCYPVIEKYGPDIFGAMHYGHAPSTVCQYLELC